MPALKGVGLIKGLGVTLKTMTRPAATRQYPHVKPDLPARSRGVIALIEENCTVCMLCSRECPDWCIYIDSHKEQVAPKEGGRARTRNILDRFAIDFALCMYCGICVEVCPFDALHWSPEFEYATSQIEKLTHEMDTLRTWAYSVPAPDPLEEGAVEPKEVESARKAREAVAAKAAAAAEQAAAAQPAPAPAAAPAAAGPAPTAGAAPASGPTGGPPAPAAAAGAGAATAAARPADVEVEPGIDQATYDRLLAAGESDRTARAKAKAAYMRRAKAEARAAQAAGATEAAPASAAAAEAATPPQSTDGGAAPAVEAGSVETPVAAVSAPETAPAAPSAAGTPEAAEPAADARDPEARSPEGEATAAGTAVDVAPGAAVAQADAEHLEIEVDQETYDRLIEAGEPERTARAKAKAAYARKLRAAQRGGGTGAGS
jgi:formate hydrogenlyase subunit 6/NADH:ubiquinone oxidoreductase subunit I